MAMLKVYCIASIAVTLLVPSLASAQDGAAAAPMAEVAPPPPPPPGALPPPPVRPADPEESHPAPNAVYVEGLGAGLFYSINYERRIIDDVGVRAGFSYVSYGASVTTGSGTSSSSVSFLTFPIGASYLGIRGGKHALELGGGVSLTYASGTSSSLGSSASGSGVGAFGNVLVGYMLHPVDHAGFNFRVGVMALMGPGFNVFGEPGELGNFGVLPWGYISFGAGF